MSQQGRMMVIAGVVVCGCSFAMLGCCVLFYFNCHESLASYRIDGLVLMICIALGAATVVAPPFAISLSGNPKDAPKDFEEAVKLFGSVIGITFFALSAVFFLLWIFGWLLALIQFTFVRFKNALLG